MDEMDVYRYDFTMDHDSSQMRALLTPTKILVVFNGEGQYSSTAPMATATFRKSLLICRKAVRHASRSVGELLELSQEPKDKLTIATDLKRLQRTFSQAVSFLDGVELREGNSSSLELETHENVEKEPDIVCVGEIKRVEIELEMLQESNPSVYMPCPKPILKKRRSYLWNRLSRRKKYAKQKSVNFATDISRLFTYSPNSPIDEIKN